MGAAFGALGWTPATFWAATLTEFMVAMEGLALVNGVEPEVRPPSAGELDEFVKKYGG